MWRQAKGAIIRRLPAGRIKNGMINYEKIKFKQGRYAAAKYAGKAMQGGAMSTSRTAATYITSKAGETAGKIMFALFLLAGMLPVIIWWAGSQALRTTMIFITLMSLMVGWVGGRESRPFIGIIVVVFALFAFSYAYTDIVGTAIFGPWWATVEAQTQFITQPLTTAFSQLGNGISDTQLLLTNPTQYYLKKEQEKVASAKAQGTTRSVEFGRIDVYPSDGIDPCIDTYYDVNIENQGEFDAENLKFYAYAPEVEAAAKGSTAGIQTGLKETKIVAGDVNMSSCTGAGIASQQSTGDDNSLVKDRGICDWSVDSERTFSKGDTRVAEFKVKWFNDTLVKSNSYEPTEGYAGTVPNLRIVAEFDYNVNVQLPIDIVTPEARRSARATTVISSYSGGPLTAALSTSMGGQQPVEGGKDVLVVASLTNKATGDVSRVSYCIYIPQGVSVSSDSADLVMLHAENDPVCTALAGESEELKNMQSVRFDYNSIKSPDSCKKDTLCNMAQRNIIINYDLKGAPSKNIILVGRASYKYALEKNANTLSIKFVVCNQ